MNKDWVSETLPSLVSDAALFIWPGLASFHCPTWGPSLDSRLYVGGKAEHLRLSSEKSLVFCLFYLAKPVQFPLPNSGSFGGLVVFMSEKRQSTLGLSWEKSEVFCLFYLSGYDSTAQVGVPRWTVVFMSEKRQSTLGLS